MLSFVSKKKKEKHSTHDKWQKRDIFFPFKQTVISIPKHFMSNDLMDSSSPKFDSRQLHRTVMEKFFKYSQKFQSLTHSIGKCLINTKPLLFILNNCSRLIQYLTTISVPLWIKFTHGSRIMKYKIIWVSIHSHKKYFRQIKKCLSFNLILKLFLIIQHQKFSFAKRIETIQKHRLEKKSSRPRKLFIQISTKVYFKTERYFSMKKKKGKKA